MKVLIDNNIVIDAIKPNPDFEKNGKKVFTLIRQGVIEPYIVSSSLTDIFYILRKVQGSNDAKTTLKNLITVFNTISLEEKDCIEALNLPNNDYDDSVISICAKKADVDYIVSRDEDFINSVSSIKVILPRTLFERLKNS